MIEMVLNAVSTRKIENITEELCGKKISKSTVSSLCAHLDPIVKAINRHFQGTTRQRCQTHFSRNILDKTPQKHQPELKKQ